MTMAMDRDWYDFWTEHPKKFATSEVFHQVARTQSGAPEPEATLETTIAEIHAALNLRGTERVLDLCCGNGMITSRIAPFCREMVGVDFSAPLIDIARARHSADNITYQVAAAAAITADLLGGKVDRAFMCASLQYMSELMLLDILTALRPCAADDFRFLIDEVPDEQKLGAFYNTAERRLDYFQRMATGEEAIGKWWRQATIQEIAERAGYDCEIITLGRGRSCAHYRFSAILRR